MIKKNKNYSLLDYILVILLLVVTDSTFFLYAKIFKLSLLVFVFIVFLLRKGKKNIDKEFLFVVIIAIGLIVAQGLLWGFSIITVFTYTGLFLFFPYFVFRIVGIDYLRIASNIIYVIAIYSSVLWFAQSFIPPVDQFLQDLANQVFPYTTDITPRSLLFYTVGNKGWTYMPEYGIYRNAGAFHEPGAFAVFLDLAIAINMMVAKKLFTKRNIFLMLVLLTTISTAGYFGLFIIIFFYYFDTKWIINPSIRILAGVFLIFLFIFISARVDFLGQKVQDQWEEANTKSLNKKTVGRIYGAKKALLVMKKYPLTGRGLISASRVSSESDEEAVKYGFMTLFSRIGIVFSIFYIIFFIKSLKRISIYFSDSDIYWQVLLFSLIINLFSQKFALDSFFMIFIFIGVLKKEKFNYLSKVNRTY